MNVRDLWRQLLAGEASERLLIDLGVTSICPPGLDTPGANELSDFARAGLSSNGRAGPVAGQAPSSYLAEEVLASCPQPGSLHPLEAATAPQLRRLAVRPADRPIQSPSSADGRERLVTVDPPCPGLLDLCMAMRGPWRFLEDLADDSPVIEALLDWALETVSGAYLRLLRVAEPPDLVVYGDDLAHRGGPFISPAEFRTHLVPRMAELFARIRAAVDAPLAILLHSCGDVSPLMADLVDLGAEVLNVEVQLLGGAATLRAHLPRDLILHGVTPLQALAIAIEQKDWRTARRLVDEAEAVHPVIVAASDVVSRDSGLEVVRAAAYVRRPRRLRGHDDLALAGRS